MGDVKRWSVTYTKHIKQKRKVYQDGLLELHTSTHKIMLYDDCEKLLVSRVVKKDEVVRCGETLTFDPYLVDVGDPEGDQKRIPDLNFQGRDKKVTEKSGPLSGKKFRNNSTSADDRKTNSGKNKAPTSNLSPSQKFIGEWQVLYTTQITQKVKKYHDGILKVASCGSQGRQVTLYDTSRRLLDSRFLKKDEVIGSGESLAFDCHLVDIGVPEGDHKSPMDLNVQGRSCNAVGKTGLLHGQQARHSSSVECGISELSNSGSPQNCLKAIKTAVKEWHALFTTQITQKAKKYHSGILKLAFCGSYRMQATLLNEDGTILSSKYLKLSEDVRTGSAFELPNYLVEVGEPRTCPEGKEVDSNCSSFDVDNITLSRRMAVNKPLHDEWQVLYTTQITQKVKKYHDGILKVASCGSQGRQVTLYDASRRLLDSRFLTKDEVIGSGESLAFNCHLVDIGVPEGDHKSPKDLNVQERSCNAVGKTGLLHGQQARHGSFVDCGISELSNSGSPPNCLKATKTAVREWHALFTTQITQKMKKYHSGILRLAFCGSYRMQATLLNEDGTILSSKYLKLSEDVRTGSAFELPKYLVEVGEPRTCPEGETHNDAYSGKEVDSNCRSFDVDNIKLSGRIAVNKPLRDAHEILSIMRKPTTQEDNIVPMERASEEKCHASQFSDFMRFHLQNEVQEQPTQDSNNKRGEEDDHVEETIQRHDYNAEMLKCKAVHRDHSLDVSKLVDSENKGESHTKGFTSSRFSLGSEASDISRPKFDAECIGRSFMRPVSSNEDPRVLDALESYFPDDAQHPTAPVPHDESNGNVETEDSMSSKAISRLCDGQFSNEVKSGNYPQRNAGSMEIGARWREGTFACNLASSSACTPLAPGGVERMSFEEHKDTSKMNECPSFDLGF
ncbi:uncharacterized protein LOC132286161 isoform X2 [Cornus florida]|uniref:uncharacterized protein LOC132286161 isoform X2 n=1 Tax=Cornus florida TaxID=4283 RepID=UPI00289887BA|nr:uncharacterized protein LOC132286161 isoform X2 [Cornus florida]